MVPVEVVLVVAVPVDVVPLVDLGGTPTVIVAPFGLVPVSAVAECVVVP